MELTQEKKGKEIKKKAVLLKSDGSTLYLTRYVFSVLKLFVLSKMIS